NSGTRKPQNGGRQNFPRCVMNAYKYDLRPSNGDIIMTLQELAERWGITYDTVRKWQSRGGEGEFPQHITLVGNRERFRLEDVLDWEERGQKPSAFVRNQQRVMQSIKKHKPEYDGASALAGEKG
ncbi:MAG: helix-turn-helix domain-containing protein, partial [Pseudomonadota bacterium]|nr:helix-turn-helix domain-containing protein [Pseudomonadota bacterium]